MHAAPNEIPTFSAALVFDAEAAPPVADAEAD
jgi:hypothetical protein